VNVPLSLEGAVKRFGDVQALAGASFSVSAGELRGLLGPNGAGKTTAIKAIAGRLPLDAGSVRLFGRALALRDPRPEIGVVPQELAIYTKLTARENLEVFGTLSGVTGSRLASRVDWALQWADLRERGREPVGRFSGGMRRRLNIACSLLHTPRVVLLDEPTVGVDPQSRERIYDMLAELRREGAAIVLTTHHLEEAEQRCDRIVIIDHGRTIAAGTLAELLRSALGSSRTIEAHLSAAWPGDRPLPAGATLAADGRRVIATAAQPARDVTNLLQAIQAAGAEVRELSVTSASLHDAFIALTGRELRE
jgi:ABC-2 type transport system ATP-binding protein